MFRGRLRSAAYGRRLTLATAICSTPSLFFSTVPVTSNTAGVFESTRAPQLLVRGRVASIRGDDQRRRHAGHLEGQLAADLARGSDGGDRRLPRFEPIGLDDFPELVERHPVLLAEADVGLGPLERQRHRFHAIDLLNGDAYPVRADGAVHAEDLQLDSRVLGVAAADGRSTRMSSEKNPRRIGFIGNLSPCLHLSNAGGSPLPPALEPQALLSLSLSAFLSLSWGPTPTTLPALASLAPVVCDHSLLGARYRAQALLPPEKIREVDAEAQLLLRLKVRLLVHREEQAGLEPVLLVEQQRRRANQN